MNILDIAKQCCYRTGDPALSNLFADEDKSRESLGYISQAVLSIIREHNWSALTKDRFFTTEGNNQEYPLPDDFSSGDGFMAGNIKFLWTEFVCINCDKTYPLDEIIEYERKKK